MDSSQRRNQVGSIDLRPFTRLLAHVTLPTVLRNIGSAGELALELPETDQAELECTLMKSAEVE
jgi:hypothetical protein